MENNINCPQKITPSNYSGVTINITSPTVNANNGSCNCTHPCCCVGSQNANGYDKTVQVYTSDTNTYTSKTTDEQTNETNEDQINKTSTLSYPPQYYMNNYNYATNPANDISKTNGTTAPEVEHVTNDNADSKEIIANLNQMVEEKHNLEKNGTETKVVALTNEYIKSLENYLNNPNSEIRLLAAEEILTRFDEDRSRYDDRALNALVNKMLQDPEKIIRTAAMSALSSGLASGNDYTVKLLKDIQKNPDSDQTDVIESANILLQKTTVQESRYVEAPQKVEQVNNPASQKEVV